MVLFLFYFIFWGDARDQTQGLAHARQTTSEPYPSPTVWTALSVWKDAGHTQWTSFTLSQPLLIAQVLFPLWTSRFLGLFFLLDSVPILCVLAQDHKFLVADGYGPTPWLYPGGWTVPIRYAGSSCPLPG
jgi:hypothetical protein